MDDMKPKHLPLVPVHVLPPGNFRSLPAEVGMGAPLNPAKPPRPLEHPQIVSTTLDLGLPPMEPTNDSTLAPGSLPGEPARPAGDPPGA
jgi:hypothetical protein